MKKHITAILILALALSLLSSCGEKEPAPVPDGTGAVYTVLDVDDGYLFLAGENESDLQYLKLGTFYVTENGEKTEKALKVGDVIKTSDNYTVDTSLPGYLSTEYVTLFDEKLPITELMNEVFDDLLEIDEGLNSDITAMYFVPVDEAYLSNGEMAGFAYLFSHDDGIEKTAIGTYDELCEQGFVNKDELYCPDGVVLYFTIAEMKTDKVKFSAEKWRGGDGAYFFMDCEGTYKNGEWSYSVGSQAIS